MKIPKKYQALTIIATVSLALAGCGGLNSQSADSEGSDLAGLPMGATKEEFQEALSDIEPIALTFQTAATSADSLSGQREEAFAAAVEEWSGGKVTVEVIYGYAVAPVEDVVNALEDGRLDIAHWPTSYHADILPAYAALQESLLSVPSSPLQGELVTHFVAQDVAFNNDTIRQEFEQQGVIPLNPMNTFGSTTLACKEPKETQADFAGNQVRSNAAAQVQQIEALGGHTVSLEQNETYEGLQRNMIQCTVGSPTALLGSGWIEQANNIYMPQDSTFIVGVGAVVAGSSWENLPLPVQQLVFDRMIDYNLGEMGQTYASLMATIETAKESGAGMYYLNDDLNTALQGGNDEILEAVRSSDDVDGDALIAQVEDSIAKWTEITEENGYLDQGDFLDFPQWYEGSGDVIDEEYLQPIIETFYSEVLAEHRPS